MHAPNAPTAFLVFSLVLVPASAAIAQTAAPAPGLRMFGELSSADTKLVDANSNVVHTWNSFFKPGLAAHLDKDGTMLRAIDTGLGVVGGSGGGVQRVKLDGTVIWNFRYDGPGHLQHHDIEAMPNGNVLFLAWEDKTVAEAIAHGRDPKLIEGNVFRPDTVVEIEPTGPTTGKIVWKWNIWDHVIQDHDSTKANYGVVKDHPELLDINFPPNAKQAHDWNHCNGIDYDPEHDWIVISSAFQREIWIIDHSTTTKEAAGHTGGRWGKGGDFLYRWGNPQAYRAGDESHRTLDFQHDPQFILDGRPGAGNLTIFNNRYTSNTSAVFEIELPVDQAGRFTLDKTGRYGPTGPKWLYTAPDFYSRIISGAERLPNGNTLVCSGAQSWMFEVTPKGERVWEHKATAFVFHAHYIERSLWAGQTELSATKGGTVQLDLIGGTTHAANDYIVLCSASGTRPGMQLGGAVLPLNYDGFVLFSLLYPNAPPFFSKTLGTLDKDGRAVAGFGLPAGLLPGPLRLDFAAAILESDRSRIRAASNPVPLRIQ